MLLCDPHAENGSGSLRGKEKLHVWTKGAHWRSEQEGIASGRGCWLFIIEGASKGKHTYTG